MSLHIELTLPSAEDFRSFRKEVSWGPLTRPQARAALAASLGGAVATLEGETVAMARLVGDGILNVYIQDVIVKERHRNTGIGQTLMIALINYISEAFPEDCLIGLFAAEGQDGFYSRFSFRSRPEIGFGPGMHATVSDLAKSSIAA